jgi:hypothetical protein
MVCFNQQAESSRSSVIENGNGFDLCTHKGRPAFSMTNDRKLAKAATVVATKLNKEKDKAAAMAHIVKN